MSMKSVKHNEVELDRHLIDYGCEFFPTLIESAHGLDYLRRPTTWVRPWHAGCHGPSITTLLWLPDPALPRPLRHDLP